MPKLVARVALRSLFDQNFDEGFAHTVGLGKLKARVRRA